MGRLQAGTRWSPPKSAQRSGMLVRAFSSTRQPGRWAATSPATRLPSLSKTGDRRGQCRQPELPEDQGRWLLGLAADAVRQPVEKVEAYLEVMAEVGAMPEFECFDTGIVRRSKCMCGTAWRNRPNTISSWGLLPACRPTRACCDILVDCLRPGSRWQTTLIGRGEIWPVHQRAAQMGAMLRTGLEDTFYLPNGERASGNGALIEALADCARLAGRDVANPAEATEMLGLKHGNSADRQLFTIHFYRPPILDNCHGPNCLAEFVSHPEPGKPQRIDDNVAVVALQFFGNRRPPNKFLRRQRKGVFAFAEHFKICQCGALAERFLQFLGVARELVGGNPVRYHLIVRGFCQFQQFHRVTDGTSWAAIHKKVGEAGGINAHFGDVERAMKLSSAKWIGKLMPMRCLTYSYSFFCETNAARLSRNSAKPAVDSTCGTLRNGRKCRKKPETEFQPLIHRCKSQLDEVLMCKPSSLRFPCR